MAGRVQAGVNMIKVSAIIPTRNPRKDYFFRVLDSIAAQKFGSGESELLIVDNGSTPPLAEWEELSARPGLRIIREEKAGCIHARNRGWRESVGQLLVFVDDDALLCGDYFAKAWEIAVQFPGLGCFGGSIHLQCEVEPEAWMLPFLDSLAARHVTRPVWSNNHQWNTIPYGVGMCVRREAFGDIVESLEEMAEFSVTRGRRKGARLGSSIADDTVIGFLMCDKGWGCGLFPELSLQHLIPKARLERDYLIWLSCSNGYREKTLEILRGLNKPFWMEALRSLVFMLAGLKPGVPGACLHIWAKCRGEWMAILQGSGPSVEKKPAFH